MSYMVISDVAISNNCNNNNASVVYRTYSCHTVCQSRVNLQLHQRASMGRDTIAMKGYPYLSSLRATWLSVRCSSASAECAIFYLVTLTFHHVTVQVLICGTSWVKHCYQVHQLCCILCIGLEA